MKPFKTLLILTLLLGEFRIPPTPAKELSAVYTTPMLARKPNVLLAAGTTPRVPSAVGSAVEGGVLLRVTMPQNASKRLADNSTVQYIPNDHPEVLGKRARMKFETTSGEEWCGVISSYNGLTGKFGIYFPCDGKTEDTSLDDEDMELID